MWHSLYIFSKLSEKTIFELNQFIKRSWNVSLCVGRLNSTTKVFLDALASPEEPFVSHWLMVSQNASSWSQDIFQMAQTSIKSFLKRIFVLFFTLVSRNIGSNSTPVHTGFPRNEWLCSLWWEADVNDGKSQFGISDKRLSHTVGKPDKWPFCICICICICICWVTLCEKLKPDKRPFSSPLYF